VAPGAQRSAGACSGGPPWKCRHKSQDNDLTVRQEDRRTSQSFPPPLSLPLPRRSKRLLFCLALALGFLPVPLRGPRCRFFFFLVCAGPGPPPSPSGAWSSSSSGSVGRRGGQTSPTFLRQNLHQVEVHVATRAAGGRGLDGSPRRCAQGVSMLRSTLPAQHCPPAVRLSPLLPILCGCSHLAWLGHAGISGPDFCLSSAARCEPCC